MTRVWPALIVALLPALTLWRAAELELAAAPGGAQSADTTFAPEVVALGEKIFQGKAAGGLCFTCHGANAKGMKGLAPNLTDGTWLHGDGSYESIEATVAQGVAKPKESGAPMPPKGGSPLTAEQIKAVSAYVWSLRVKK
jgi:mono/diheme cytochrome c family protein